MPTPVAFDARPLTDPVDRRAARNYARRLRAQGALGSTSAAVVSIVIAAAVGAVFLFTILPILFSVAITARNAAPVFLVPLLILAGIGAVIAITVRTQRVRLWRLGRFAEANRLRYTPAIDGPALPGMIFSLGSSRRATDVLTAETPRRVDYANYRYTTGSGKNRTTHTWGYVAIRLDVPLPNIVLDATSNNGLFGSNLPASFDRHQRLHLEGDFDRHFALYCPEGYERDALYLFTPDIMARFIDSAAALDVEIVDDWLFLYAKREFSTLDPATWEWLFSVVAAFQDKFAQWARWRDERMAAAAPASVPAASPGAPAAPAVSAPVAGLLRPPPGVAPEGRRLKRGVSWTTIVIVVALGAYWLFSAVTSFGH